jgi:acyl carrier protein
VTDTPRSKQPVLDSIISIVSEESGLPAVAESNLVEQLGFDSMDLISLCMQIEAEFDIDEFDYDPETMITVNDVARYVQSQVNLKTRG